MHKLSIYVYKCMHACRFLLKLFQIYRFHVKMEIFWDLATCQSLKGSLILWDECSCVCLDFQDFISEFNLDNNNKQIFILKFWGQPWILNKLIRSVPCILFHHSNISKVIILLPPYLQFNRICVSDRHMKNDLLGI